MSDKVLTQQSGCFFLSMETVLADRDFTIADDIALHGAKLVIPSFTRGKAQKNNLFFPSVHVFIGLKTSTLS